MMNSKIMADIMGFYRSLPKVELHRHLEGSIRTSTLLDIARDYNLDFSPQQLPGLTSVQPGDPYTFSNFLSKFTPLRQFYRSPEIIQRVTREAIEDAAEDGICYLELRFTPVALGRIQKFPLDECMDWVIETGLKAAADLGITVQFIASTNRHESVDLADQVMVLATKRLQKGMVGLDLAGNEADFSALPFLPVFRQAQANGLKVTIHAGEWGRAANVSEAITVFHADRIGHGVRLMEDPDIVRTAQTLAFPLEVCISSNVQSGVTPSLKEHPITRMLAAGLNVTLGTDDPAIEQIKLSEEYHLAETVLNIPRASLLSINLAGAKAAFLPDSARQLLEDKIRSATPVL